MIDGTIAVDAGGLCAGLTVQESLAIEDVLITHHHFDHVTDLMWLGLATVNAEGPRSMRLHCSQVAHDVIKEHLFPLWGLDFFKPIVGPHATFTHKLVRPGQPFRVGPYEVLPLDNRHHPVPVVAYQFTTPSGKRLVYTGDCGPGIRDIWPFIQPDLLITEVTLPNRHSELAGRVGHLSPDLLHDELVAFRDGKGYLPRVLVVHVNSADEAEVGGELVEVARRLHATIDVAHEGMRVKL